MYGVMTRRAVCALAGLACIAWAGSANAASMSFKVDLTGAQEVPPVKTDGMATADLTWNPDTRTITWDISYSHMSSDVTMAHFHEGAKGKNGKVKVWLTQKGSPVSSPITGKATLTPTEAKNLEHGMLYINVHSKDHPAGEIRGQVMPPKG
jgi:CHRD domain